MTRYFYETALEYFDFLVNIYILRPDSDSPVSADDYTNDLPAHPNAHLNTNSSYVYTYTNCTHTDCL